MCVYINLFYPAYFIKVSYLSYPIALEALYLLGMRLGKIACFYLTLILPILPK